MSNTRAEILGRLRRSLKAAAENPGRREAVATRIGAKARGPVPARSDLPRQEIIALFVEQAEAVSASVARIAGESDVPKAVADYLKGQNLPAEIRIAPDPALEGLSWDEQPLLEVESGRARPEDAT